MRHSQFRYLRRLIRHYSFDGGLPITPYIKSLIRAHLRTHMFLIILPELLCYKCKRMTENEKVKHEAKARSNLSTVYKLS